MDPAKISIIVNLCSPTCIKQLRSALGHIEYHRRFIRGYASITTPLERLLKKNKPFVWTSECENSFNTPKSKLVSAPTLIYLDWNMKFHMHIVDLGISLGVILVQFGEGNLDHQIYFTS